MNMSEKGFWWCSKCHEEVDVSRVTQQKLHASCGHEAFWIDAIILPKSERRIRPCWGCIHWEESELDGRCKIAAMVDEIGWKRVVMAIDADEDWSFDALLEDAAKNIPCDYNLWDNELKTLMEALP
jgi:hypothetical protein